MESKTDQLNRLFDEWEKNVPEYKGKFVRDGIINEQLYQTTSLKILFIMKEPNDPKQEAWDFRDWWKEKIKYAFSYRIGEWSYGLFNNFPPYDDIWTNPNSVYNAIQQIAFMNIKKSGGGANSEYERMLNHLRLNLDYLQREIQIISPDIIITGLTWKEHRNVLFNEVKWINSGYDIPIGKLKNIKIIDFYHPSSRTAPAASYSLLQNIVRSDNFKML